MFALVSRNPKIIFTWTAWHADRHQRVVVCYNGLLSFTFGFLTYNWFNFRCDIQVLSSIHLAEVSFTLVSWRSTDREQQQLYKTDILLTATIMVSVARKQVFFFTDEITLLLILNWWPISHLSHFHSAECDQTKNEDRAAYGRCCKRAQVRDYRGRKWPSFRVSKI